jgi:hypothetical protein
LLFKRCYDPHFLVVDTSQSLKGRVVDIASRDLLFTLVTGIRRVVAAQVGISTVTIKASHVFIVTSML